MVPSADRILKEFADKVRRSYPSAEVSLFGSYAKGSAKGDSDLDICVVLPKLGAHDRFAVSDIAWEVSLSHNIHLSTVVFSKNDIEEGAISTSPLVESIRNEGVAVWLPMCREALEHAEKFIARIREYYNESCE